MNDKETQKRRIAVMQPYLFPYLGYFHLIHASTTFVFYDDVSYIKGGWINRNRILNKGQDLLFTVPVVKASSHRLIKDTAPALDRNWTDKFHKQLVGCYKKAPFFNDAVDVIMAPFAHAHESVADLCIESVNVVLDYLGFTYDYTRSSVFAPETRGLDRAERLIAITRKMGATDYVNPSGARSLYRKQYFKDRGVALWFLESRSSAYPQFSEPFVHWLSVIDVIMFCKPALVIELMAQYSLQ